MENQSIGTSVPACSDAAGSGAQTGRRGRPGRPQISQDLEKLVVFLAQKNCDWGYGRIAQEVERSGYTISDQSVANCLKRHNIPPASVRRKMAQ